MLMEVDGTIETPYTMNIREIHSLTGIDGYGTSALVSVPKIYYFTGYGISNEDSAFFREGGCANTEGAIPVTNHMITISFNAVGNFSLCYFFNGEQHAVEFSQFIVRVAQISSIEPPYVAKTDMNTLTITGNNLLESDEIGFTMTYRIQDCVFIPISHMDEQTIVIDHAFTEAGNYTICMRLDGYDHIDLITGIIEHVVEDHSIDNVEGTLFPVTTVSSYDTHLVSFYGKTVSSVDKVKFVKTMNCEEEATIYSVTKYNFMVTVEALFNEKIDTVYICYKFHHFSLFQ